MLMIVEAHPEYALIARAWLGIGSRPHERLMIGERGAHAETNPGANPAAITVRRYNPPGTERGARARRSGRHRLCVLPAYHLRPDDPGERRSRRAARYAAAAQPDRAAHR